MPAVIFLFYNHSDSNTYHRKIAIRQAQGRRKSLGWIPTKQQEMSELKVWKDIFEQLLCKKRFAPAVYGNRKRASVTYTS
jgi:hypothetical protein